MLYEVITHPLREQTANCRWIDVRPSYGASATILFEYLQAHGVKIATKLATILFSYNFV